MDKILEQSISQLLALVTFFAFPAIQYLLLKWAARKEGLPRLGYVPQYGFRLAIRNIPRRRVLKEIKYEVFLRSRIPAPRGSTADTSYEIDIFEREKLFVFQDDQIMLSFQLHGIDKDNIEFIVTDKLGNKIQNGVPINNFQELICDYSAKLINFFNFNIEVEKRIVIKSSSLIDMWHETHLGYEKFKEFKIDEIKDANSSLRKENSRKG